MPDSLVESQFDALEEPTNALTISGEEEIKKIVKKIKNKFNI